MPDGELRTFPKKQRILPSPEYASYIAVEYFEVDPKNYLYFVVLPLCMCLQYVRVRSHKKREVCDIIYFHGSSALHMKL